MEKFVTVGTRLQDIQKTCGGLNTPHLDDLIRSGLSKETIEASGIYTGHRGMISTLLGFDVTCNGMVIPYLNVAEPYVRVKLDQPGEDGKRYRSPKNSLNRLYVPPLLDSSVLADAAQPLWITEGEKKALKACQEGLPCVAVPGVWSWRADGKPIPDLDSICWGERSVTIVFDSDAVRNEHVFQAERELATELARRGATVFSIRLPEGQGGEKIGLDDYLVRDSIEAFRLLIPEQIAPKIFAVGLGNFLAQQFNVLPPLIQDILPAEASGWIAGEEKLGKTLYMLDEALCLALGRAVCGKFDVPVRQRVLFIEEDDGPLLMKTRIDAFLRGYGLDPYDAAARRELNDYFRVSVWSGFCLDDDEWIISLEREIQRFTPRVVYLDALFKMTTQDLLSPREATKVIRVFDGLTRKYGCSFRVIHHFRKGQGFGRHGRGSQELNGSYVLGAWAQTSLFLEPRGKKYGEAKLQVQTKQGAPIEPFKLVITSEGPGDAPTVYRLRAEELHDTKNEELEEQVFNAIGTLDKTKGYKGRDGVSKAAIAKVLDKPSSTIRSALDALKAKKRIAAVGKTEKNAQLWEQL